MKIYFINYDPYGSLTVIANSKEEAISIMKTSPVYEKNSEDKIEEQTEIKDQEDTHPEKEKS